MLKELEEKLREQHAAWTETICGAPSLRPTPARSGPLASRRFADLVSLVRFALEQQPVLEPFAASVTPASTYGSWTRPRRE
jgi:hypothetical protein